MLNAEENDHYSFKVRFLGDSSETTRAASGADGLLLLNPRTGLVAFHGSGSPPSAPAMVSYDGKAISNISTEIKGKIRKKQLLLISFEEEDMETTAKFETLEEKASTVAAAILSFRNEISTIAVEKSEPQSQISKKFLGDLGDLAQSLEKTIGKEVQKISATIQETIGGLAELDQVGKKLKLAFQVQDDSENIDITVDEFVNAAENSGIFEAIFGALMAKGMVSAASEDWKTSLETLRKAREEASREEMLDQFKEAERQIKRIEAISKESKKKRPPERHISTDEKAPEFKEVSMDEAQRYLEGVDRIIAEWEDESQPDKTIL
ncbi:MAG: hypothetical protein ACFFGZ_02305 [Candidatus Thorarchaeota archaeon]